MFCGELRRVNRMTVEEMTQITLSHWKMNYPEKIKKIKQVMGKEKGEEWIMRQAVECAKMTRSEMNTIKIGTQMTEEEAWAESRSLFCMTEAPDPEEPEWEEDPEVAKRRHEQYKEELNMTPEELMKQEEEYRKMEPSLFR